MATAFARAYHSLYDAPKISDDALVRALFAYEEYEGISAHMAQGIAFFDPARTSVRTHPE